MVFIDLNRLISFSERQGKLLQIFLRHIHNVAIRR